MITKEIYRKTILNKAKFPANTYTANPYVGCPHACRYCYAMYMSQWTGHTEPWGTFLDVKKWPNLTDKQLEKLEGCDIQIGTVCDPYNPMEAQFQRTRHLLEELTKVNCPCYNHHQIFSGAERYRFTSTLSRSSDLLFLSSLLMKKEKSLYGNF